MPDQSALSPPVGGDARAAEIRRLVDAAHRTAATGDSEAMYNLGVHAAGLDPPDIPVARRWYAQAAALGHVAAMVNLGSLFAAHVDPPDLAAARRWWERAAAAGETAAMFNVGVLLAEVIDSPDPTAARYWYERAAATGRVDAMGKLGVLLSTRIAPPDVAGARYWLERAAAGGDRDAMFQLGALTTEQLDPPDLETARQWYDRAARLGHLAAMRNLVILAADRTTPADVPTAQYWFGHLVAARQPDVDDLSALIQRHSGISGWERLRAAENPNDPDLGRDTLMVIADELKDRAIRGDTGAMEELRKFQAAPKKHKGFRLRWP